jgi:hypothetical protein
MLKRFFVFNAVFTALLYLQVVATFQSFERTDFDCEIVCRNPHILYTLGLPLFLVTTGLMIYLLVKENDRFKEAGKSLFIKTIRLENRALLWIWLIVGAYGYLLSNTTDIDHLRGPFVIGILLSLVYSIFNALRFLYKNFQTKSHV